MARALVQSSNPVEREDRSRLELRVLAQLQSNTALSLAERAVFQALHREAQYLLDKGAVAPDGFVHIYLESVADLAGISARRVGAYLKRFADWKLIERRQERHYVED